jgi:hypothetical protein
MKLYKIEASNWETFFGTREEPIERDVIRIAQTPSNDAFLLLAKDTFDELELLDSVPTGFDFTYCQEWGLTVDDDVIDRVIIDLRKKAYQTWKRQKEDYIYHHAVDGWKADINTQIKEKYPKR